MYAHFILRNLLIDLFIEIFSIMTKTEKHLIVMVNEIFLYRKGCRPILPQRTDNQRFSFVETWSLQKNWQTVNDFNTLIERLYSEKID